jgi:class 3 adenylate cyclase
LIDVLTKERVLGRRVSETADWLEWRIWATLSSRNLSKSAAELFTSLTAVIVQACGTVGTLLNNGALAYFGYPRADQHEAERAIRAGLNLVETAGRIATSHTDRLHVRVGIASGLVVVAGLGASGEPLAFGEAATSAAGLFRALKLTPC